MNRAEFGRSLDAFYRDRGKVPPQTDPNLAGKPVSLYLLFERVTKLGKRFKKFTRRSKVNFLTPEKVHARSRECLKYSLITFKKAEVII